MVIALLFLMFSVLLLFFGPLGWALSGVFFLLFLITLFIKMISGTAKALRTTKCPFCKSTISVKATVCPSCQSQLIEQTVERKEIDVEVLREQEEMRAFQEQQQKQLQEERKQKAKENVKVVGNKTNQFFLSMKEKFSHMKLGEKIEKLNQSLINSLKKLDRKQTLTISGIVVFLVIGIVTFQLLKPEKTYYSSGSLLYQGDIVDDYYHGNGKMYDEDGNLLYDGEWHHSKREGIGKSYIDGVLEYNGNWIDDEKNGKGTSYDKDGNKVYVGQFKDGHYHGDGELYDRKGKLLFGGEFYYGAYENGEGILQDNGKTIAQGKWVNGMMNGDGTIYHENGEVSEEGLFENDLLIDGTYYDYFDDGQLKEKGNYIASLKDGEWKQFHDNEQLAYESTYKAGERIKVKRWDSNGNELAINKLGNTNGNILNNGVATAEGSVHYYIVNDGDSRIVTNDSKGELHQLLNAKAEQLQVKEDEIYFLEKGKVNRFNKDERKIKQIIDRATQFIVVEDNIFFTTKKDAIYRSNLYGNDIMQIYSSEDREVSNLNYVNNKLFFTDGRYSSKRGVYSINLDGSNLRKLVGEDMGVQQLIATDDHLYFNVEYVEDYESKYDLIRSNHKGDKRKVILKDRELSTFNINIEDKKEDIFFTDYEESNYLYRLRDGKVKQLNSDSTDSINILKDEIIYVNKGDSNKVYRINMSGKNREILN